MADDSKRGPLTAEDLLAIWRGGSDTVYTEPYVRAGDGAGLEVHTQAFQQHARVSQAVDRTFQSMYALPWSGQTGDSAGNAAQATCEVAFTRAGRLGDALVLGRGLIWVDEQAQDMDPTGPILVGTGRRYLLADTVVFFPGERGPFEATVVAEKPGYGYNNPRPGSLSLLEQPGSGRTNDIATVSQVTAPVPPANPVPAQAVTLTGSDTPDMFTPDQVGQYVGFSAGANEGLSGRIVGFAAPTSTAGSAVQLEQLVTVRLAATPSPAFVLGLQVQIKNGGTVVGSGTVLAARPGPGGYCVAIALQSGAAAPALGYTLLQNLMPAGTATGTIAFVLGGGQFAAEAPSGSPLAGGATWAVLDWARDWLLTSSNALSPAGGAIDMLGALGGEKNLPQLPGESAQEYALRITKVADVVSPNAIKRALVRGVGGVGWCFREVGGALLPGFFFDRTDPGGDSYDSGALLFSGSHSGPTMLGREPCEYRRNGAGGHILVVAEGYYGTTTQTTVVTNPAGSYPATYVAPTDVPCAGATFTFVLSKGRFDQPLRAIARQAGDTIVGLVSKGTFNVSAAVAAPGLASLRWHCLLDYEQMRAFFMAGVPKVGLGEFGMAYDAGTEDAYDAGAPWLNFYDGYPAGNLAFYGRVFGDVQRVKAGGVAWELYETNGLPCT